MIPRRLPIAIWSLLVATAWCTGSAPAQASFEFTEAQWDSATEFLAVARSELGANRVVLGARIDWDAVTARDAVLLLHPERAVDATEASSFVSAGGRLAVVDDFGKGDQLLSRFHIKRALAPKPPKESYRDNPHLVLARPVVTETGNKKQLKHPMVAGLDQVVTNHPTAFHIDPKVELTPVLTLEGASGERHLFAAIGVIGDGKACGLEDGIPTDPRARCGRLFAMADASVFIDLMMRFEGNRELARGLVRYLVEDDNWGKRQGKLYVVSNAFTESGHFGGQTDVTREVDRIVENLESLLDETREEGLPDEWAWALAMLAVFGTAVFAWASSGRLYQRPMPRYARPQPLSAQPGAAGRAAVLAAPTTHASLVLLELKAAAEEYLRTVLSLPDASGRALLEALHDRGALDPPRLELLRSAFAQMERAEKALLNSENLRIRPESITKVHRRLTEILPLVSPRGAAGSFSTRGGPSSDPDPRSLR